MNRTVDIAASINGEEIRRSVPAHTLLVDFLREEIGAKSVKRSCDTQICGACTVLVDGRPFSSCTTLAADIDGASVLTVEGMSSKGELDPIQEAFLRHGAVQCGFCTPGFILAAKALLAETPKPSREEIVHHLKGNLCRCTGYKKIIEAVEDAASA